MGDNRGIICIAVVKTALAWESIRGQETSTDKANQSKEFFLVVSCLLIILYSVEIVAKTSAEGLVLSEASPQGGIPRNWVVHTLVSPWLSCN